MTSAAVIRRPARETAGSIDTRRAARNYAQASPAPLARRVDHPGCGKADRSTGHQGVESTYTRTAQGRAMRASLWRRLPLLVMVASQGCRARTPSPNHQTATPVWGRRVQLSSRRATPGRRPGRFGDITDVCRALLAAPRAATRCLIRVNSSHRKVSPHARPHSTNMAKTDFVG
jgi:hypothetical protein